MGKRLGSLIPMALMLLFVAISYYTGMVRELVPTVLLLAAGAGLINILWGHGLSMHSQYLLQKLAQQYMGFITAF